MPSSPAQPDRTCAHGRTECDECGFGIEKTIVEHGPRGAAELEEVPSAELHEVFLEVGAATEANLTKGGINEDALIADEHSRTFGVLDGMGGHAAGEVASSKGAEFIRGALLRIPKRFAHDGDAVASHVQRAIEQASMNLQRMAEADESKKGMGATCSLIHLIEDPESGKPREAVVANVGDSRVYRFRNGALERLTHDQTPIEALSRTGPGGEPPFLAPGADQDIRTEIDMDALDRLVRGGRKDLERAYLNCFAFRMRRHTAPTVGGIRNIIDGALGLAEVRVDVQRVALEDGDVLFATSDGVHDNLLDSEIAALAAKHENNPTGFTQALIAASRARERTKDAASSARRDVSSIDARGKDDDITAVAVRIEQTTDKSGGGIPWEADLDANLRAWRAEEPLALANRAREYGVILARHGRGEPISPHAISRVRGSDGRPLRTAYEAALASGDRATTMRILAEDQVYKTAALRELYGALADVGLAVSATTRQEWERAPSEDLHRRAETYRRVLMKLDADVQLNAQEISRVSGRRERYLDAVAQSDRHAVQQLLAEDRLYKQSALAELDRILSQRAA